MNYITYDIPPELDIETIWQCGVDGCNSYCFDKEVAEIMGCAVHGFKWCRVVRQFENGILVSEFKEKL